MALSFILLFIVSACLISFVSLGLDALAVNAGTAKASQPAKPRTGIIVKESESVSWYALGLATDGKAIQGLVKADFDSLGDTISYKPRAGFPEQRLGAPASLPGIVDSILKDAAVLCAFIRASGVVARAAAGFAVAFFFCTLWLFPRVGSWPLFGALLALLAFRAALLFAALSTSSGFATVARNYFPAPVGAWLPHACMIGIGVLILASDLLGSVARGKRAGRAA